MDVSIHPVKCLALALLLGGTTGCVSLTATRVGLMEVCMREPTLAYHSLGRVFAESERFNTAQENMEYALRLAKAQASRLGASAILLDREFSQHWGAEIISNVYFEQLDADPSLHQSVSGQAIHFENAQRPHGCLRGVAQY